MTRIRVSGYSILAAIFLATSTSARSSSHIFSRQASTCAATGFNKCPQSGLPDNFCCPSTSTCLPLAGNTTVLCCPTGSDCTQIRPIICDIAAQDADKKPENTLKTTALTVVLGKCGEGCCPFGYSCNSQNNCQKNADQDTAPVPASSSSSPTPSATSPSPSSEPPLSTSPSSTATNSASSTVLPINGGSQASCAQFPTTAVLVGFFPGLILGILISIATIWALGVRRRRKDAASPQKRQSGSSFGNISEPRLQSDLRTDFLRKAPPTANSGVTYVGSVGNTPERKPTLKRVRSLFRRSSNSGVAEMSDYPRGSTLAQNYPPPIPLALNQQKSTTKAGPPHTKANRPFTPPLQREPSYENIDIFTDEDTASAIRKNGSVKSDDVAGGRKLAPPPRIGSGAIRGSTNTTFSDMMESSGLAGLQKGQPFVYKGSSPGYAPR